MAILTAAGRGFTLATDDNEQIEITNLIAEHALISIYGEQVENPTDPEEPDPGDPDPGGTSKFTAPLPKSLWTNAWNTDYGPRPGVGKGWHDGIDFGNYGAAGSPVRACADGRVMQTWNYPYNAPYDVVNWRGCAVALDHGVVNGGGGYNGKHIYSLYCHMAGPPTVSVGQNVTAGQSMGIVGNTGQSFGAHLHWEIHVGTFGNYTSNYNGSTVDPAQFIKAWGDKWGF